MKLKFNFSKPSPPLDSELVRTFGSAELLRHATGEWELRGGTSTDRLEAREWISLFCHEAVVSSVNRRQPLASRAARPCVRAGFPGRN